MKAHSDEYWMRLALEEAKRAFQEDEVPVGAVIIKDEKIVACAHNSTESSKNALAHAEIFHIL